MLLSHILYFFENKKMQNCIFTRIESYMELLLDNLLKTSFHEFFCVIFSDRRTSLDFSGITLYIISRENCYNICSLNAINTFYSKAVWSLVFKHVHCLHMLSLLLLHILSYICQPFYLMNQTHAFVAL